jgi:hypothetical protein
MVCNNSATHDDVTAETFRQKGQADAKMHVYECRNGYSFIASIEEGKSYLGI